MRTSAKKLVHCFTGILAGLAAWSLTEMVLVVQTAFSSYIQFHIFLGALFGLIFGAFFGCGEGIYQSDARRTTSGLLIGALIGTIAGVIGFYLGHLFLLLMSEMLIRTNPSLFAVGVPLSKTAGWALLGIIIASIEGIRWRSPVKIRIGVISGLLGGLAGGLMMAFLKIRWKNRLTLLSLGLKRSRILG